MSRSRRQTPQDGPISPTGGRPTAEIGSSSRPPVDTSICGSVDACPIESVALQLDSNNRPHVAYEKWDNGEELLFYTKSTDGSTFSASVTVSPERTYNWHIYKVHLMLSADDAPMIVWQDRKIGKWAGFFATSTDGGLSFNAPTAVTDSGGTFGSAHEFDVVQGPDKKPYFIYSRVNSATNLARMFFKSSTRLTCSERLLS